MIFLFLEIDKKFYTAVIKTVAKLYFYIMKNFMKRIKFCGRVLSVLVLLLSITTIFFGCSKKENKGSEISVSYVEQELYIGRQDDVILEIAIGKSENPFVIDGTANPTCDFARIDLKAKNKLTSCSFVIGEEKIEAKVTGTKGKAIVYETVVLSDLTVKAEVDEKEIEFRVERVETVNLSDLVCKAAEKISGKEYFAAFSKDRLDLGRYFYIVATYDEEAIKSVAFDVTSGEIMAESYRKLI